MKTIKNSKEITTLEVGDVVVFGDLTYRITQQLYSKKYYLQLRRGYNDRIFEVLNINKIDFIEKLGIDTDYNTEFPETKSLEALTAIVSALFKEYEKQNQFPKTWEEFCERNRIKDECYISNSSGIICVEGHRSPNTDKNLCISKQEAKAFLALMQLRQLRKCYVGDWEPDWSRNSPKVCIVVNANSIKVTEFFFLQNSLSFPTYELAEQFLINFKDLLEIAKPLL